MAVQGEIADILKPGGLYQGTMLSKRDAQFGCGRPVAPDETFRTRIGFGVFGRPVLYDKAAASSPASFLRCIIQCRLAGDMAYA